MNRLRGILSILQAFSPFPQNLESFPWVFIFKSCIMSNKGAVREVCYMIVVIPAYQPEPELIEFVYQLREKTTYPILVVDDGSSPDKAFVFNAIESIGVVLRHPRHMGRGQALKTAFAYAQNAYSDEPGIVVAGADGSCTVENVLAVSEALLEHPDAYILGSRRYIGRNPLPSRLADTLFRYVFAFASGSKLRDAGTGLRAFSIGRIPELLNCPGDGTEYDVTVLMDFIRKQIPVVEVPVEAVRLKHSPIDRLSFRRYLQVYSAIFKYTGVAVLSFGVDYLLSQFFYTVLSRTTFAALTGISPVGMGNVLARAFSSTLNFILNRQLVFRDRSNLLVSVLKYYTVVALILLINTVLLIFFHEWCGIPAWIAKLMTETLMFAVSMLMQRLFVFRGKSRQKKPSKI